MSNREDQLDRMIEEALDAEDRDLMKTYGQEEGYFTQALSMFRGKLGWVMWLAYLMNIIGAGVAIWAGWHLFQTTDPVMAIRWGVGALAAFNLGLFFKGVMGTHGETQRMMRELKRIELQIVRGQARESV